ncbi:hypothetical protein Vadar_022616 [Vaccinium darrowii]|uniref:Uncharacterized protein n=1 Tax=Vaccinium darrowii TaxID=229202 RepID=A0ACB7YGE1_9ERIC|nr:hypothetical protein Vadar_022616 [Vaccinium darrowii]
MASPDYNDASQELKIVAAEEGEITNAPSPTLLKNKSKRTTFLSSLGCYECFLPEVWRASVGELLGTAVLVFMIDTIVISTFQMETQTPNLIFSTLLAISQSSSLPWLLSLAATSTQSSPSLLLSWASSHSHRPRSTSWPNVLGPCLEP